MTDYFKIGKQQLRDHVRERGYRTIAPYTGLRLAAIWAAIIAGCVAVWAAIIWAIWNLA